MRHENRSERRGQAMVEFMLVLPILALLLVLAVDMGRVFFGYVALTNATRIGASDAARDPDSWAGGGSDDLYYERIAADMVAMNCDADTNDDGVINAADLPAPQYVNRVGTADPHEFGDHVTVKLTCEFGLMTPLASMLVGDSVTIGAETTFAVIGAKINGIPVPPDPPTSPCLPTERIVPDLVGLSVATARDRWEGLGFSGGFSPSDPALDEDTVTAQSTSPAAAPGSCLSFYASVTVVHAAPAVCTAPQVNVPNMIGLTLTVARQVWQDAGFDPANFTPPSGNDSMLVLSQTVTPPTPPGECVDVNAGVVVTYGDAPAPPPPTCTAPQLVNLKASAAKTEWETSGFTGAFSTQPSNKSNWYVKSQNLVGGQDYPCTSSVIVYLENR